MREIPDDLRLAMMLTSPSTSIALIPMKVTKATRADLNVSSIQYWAPHLGAPCPLTFKLGL